jgi:hypothetical protein
LQAELRRQIAAKDCHLAELATEIERQQQSLAQLNRNRFTLAGELASLEQQQGSYRASAAAARQAADLAQAELREFIAERERAEAELAELAERHSAMAAELTAIEAAKATELAALGQLQAQQQRLQQQIARLEAEIATIRATVATERERANRELSAELAAAAELARDGAEAEMEAIAATVAGARAEAEAELAAARDEIELARAQASQIRDEAVASAEAEIELARRKFQLEAEAVLNTIEREKLEASKAIHFDEQRQIERWRPILAAPLEAEIEALEVENGRLIKLLSAKQGNSLEWQPEQIKQLLVRALDDGNLRPNHLRIAGESESGKSHLVNQLLTSGIAAMGLSCDIELYDPYPSDTNWAISPTIADDPEAVVARLAELRELCESASPAKRQRPLLIVLDEGDELIRQFKTAVTDSLKAILKRGRHVNLILWVMGQNGNVKGLSPMDWSDLKNAGAIYLNQVGYDYIKNGLSGRASNTLQGEIDAIAGKHSYYALIHPKGAPRPYAVAVPKRLFPDSHTGEGETPAQAPAQPAPPPGALVCPKCQSSKVKRNGGGRIYCHDCGKNSTVGK